MMAFTTGFQTSIRPRCASSSSRAETSRLRTIRTSTVAGRSQSSSSIAVAQPTAAGVRSGGERRAMRTIGVTERQARLGVRLFLAKPASRVEEAAAGMVGLHSSDPTSVYLSARARLGRMTHADLEDALYERRSLVRMLGMRATLFVTTPELAAEIDAACTKAIAATERRRVTRLLEEQGVAADGGV